MSCPPQVRAAGRSANGALGVTASFDRSHCRISAIAVCSGAPIYETSRVNRTGFTRQYTFLSIGVRSDPDRHPRATPSFELTKRFICTLDASCELPCLGAGLTIDARVAILAKEHEIFVIAPFSRVLSRTTGRGGWRVASSE
jgi:hypothetical protein